MEVVAQSKLVGLRSVKSAYNLYLNKQETSILVCLVQSVNPKVMIEIGCQLGRTAKAVLSNVPSLKTYIGVDVPWDYAPNLKCQQSEVPYSPGKYAADDNRFFLYVAERGSLGIGPQDLEPCDAVFIDGDHSEQAVRHDSYLARALVRPGGIIIWHDFDNPAVEVTRTLLGLCDKGWPIHHVQTSWLAFMRV